MRRILLVTSAERNFGTYWRCRNLCEALSLEGDEVTLVCPSNARSSRAVRAVVNQRFQVVELPYISGMRSVIDRGIHTLVGFGQWHLRRYDIVHVFAPVLPETWVPAILSKVANQKLVVDVDDWWGSDAGLGNARISMFIGEAFERSAIRFANRITVVSEELKRRYGHLNRSTISVIGNGVAPTLFDGLNLENARRALRARLGLSEQIQVILGLYDPRFIEPIRKACAELAKSDEQVKVLLIGAQPGGALPIDQRSRGVNSPLLTLPRIAHGEIIEALLGSDATIMLMEEIPWDRARFPIRLGEFMLCGKPIIASPVGATRRILEAAGYVEAAPSLIVPNEPNALCTAFRSALRTTPEIERAVARLVSFARSDLDWTRIAHQVSEVYADVR